MPGKRILPAQRILDEQGHLVIAAFERENLQIGQVLSSLTVGVGWEPVPGPMVIVGSASREEWVNQAITYSGGLSERERREIALLAADEDILRPFLSNFPTLVFFRVVAE